MNRTIDELKEAFEIIDENAQDDVSKRPYLVKHHNIMKELVERATPKPLIENSNLYGGVDHDCPYCGNTVTNWLFSNFCPDCGQAIGKENKQ